jgi:uncharacterized repeat protein (TIGR03803 family)
MASHLESGLFLTEGNGVSYLSMGLLAGVLVVAGFAQGLPAAASSDKILHSFGSGSDGKTPAAGLIAVKGMLYGTTQLGGSVGAGTVFKVDPASGSESVVHAFSGGAGDGAFPNSGLLDEKNTLYGTSAGGGTDGDGAVFAINPKTGAVKMLHSFLINGVDGYAPWASVIEVKKKLYGTTVDGGAYGLGTVFEVDPGTGDETVLHSFGGSLSDGFQPQAALIDVKGTLYGTASGGGATGSGVVFKIDPSSGTESVIYSFSDENGDGYSPEAALVNLKGNLYGTAAFGGAYGAGAAFVVTPANGHETVLHSFGNGSDGQLPVADLLNVKGTLYGTTQLGGTSNAGTVFEMASGTGAESVVYSFQSSGGDGTEPVAGLINVKGNLYGTTNTGGANGGGTAFEVAP